MFLPLIAAVIEQLGSLKSEAIFKQMGCGCEMYHTDTGTGEQKNNGKMDVRHNVPSTERVNK